MGGSCHHVRCSGYIQKTFSRGGRFLELACIDFWNDYARQRLLDNLSFEDWKIFR
jgi:hypothetical protein